MNHYGSSSNISLNDYLNAIVVSIDLLNAENYTDAALWYIEMISLLALVLLTWQQLSVAWRSIGGDEKPWPAKVIDQGRWHIAKYYTN